MGDSTPLRRPVRQRVVDAKQESKTIEDSDSLLISMAVARFTGFDHNCDYSPRSRTELYAVTVFDGSKMYLRKVSW